MHVEIRGDFRNGEIAGILLLYDFFGLFQQPVRLQLLAIAHLTHECVHDRPAPNLELRKARIQTHGI
ncbi:hypothetical protein D3C71_2128960 [compost metagenome]